MTAGRCLRVAPDNGWLVAAGALCAAAATTAPLLLFGTALHVLLAAGALVAGATILFSVRRALMVLLLVAAVLPGTAVGLVRLPFGLRPWELVLLPACLFAVVDLVALHGLRLRRTPADRLVLAFLVIAVAAMLIGLAHGHEAVLRNTRFTLYYGVFFLVVLSVRRTDVTRWFAPLLVLCGVVVSAEYLLEFLGAIDLSAGERFVRVSHAVGVMLPVSMLVLTNAFVHDPRRWGRPALFALFLFTGLSFAITMGRGMWAAFVLGLLVTVWLWHTGQPAGQRRAWRSIVLAVGLVAALTASVLAFQQFTGTAISAHAVARSRSFVDVGSDIQLISRLRTYGNAIEEIARHPLVGSGQGATVKGFSFNPNTSRFETWDAWSVDSLYLTLWLQLGLGGLLVFPALGLCVARSALRSFRRSRDPETRAFCASAVATLAAMALLGLSDASMVNGQFAAIFAILFGLVMVVGADDGDGDRPRPAAAPSGAHEA